MLHLFTQTNLLKSIESLVIKRVKFLSIKIINVDNFQTNKKTKTRCIRIY